ncbi:MAG: hypothetical protein JRH11_27060 [Deltaproteobacteria bacterium]|nr:hypothetical protein [Deltaproteobacteria bacterium]
MVFAAVLWPFREVFLENEASQWPGFFKLWLLLVGIGILSPYGPSPGSIEGVIYTKISARHHLFGLPEVLAQSAAFTFFLTKWCKRPHRAWGIAFGIGGILVVLVSLAALFLQPPPAS